MSKSAPQAIKVPSTQLHQTLGSLLKKVGSERQHIIVERGGYPIIAMIPISEYYKMLAQSHEEDDSPKE
jgi:PHD/YefM family antitoxin component YafN of YafNO toxin-antitoxin module